MSIPIIDTLKPLGNFPAVNSEDVDVNGTRLDAVLSSKANTSDIGTLTANKADKSYVDSELAKKANTTDIPTVSGKADKTYVDAELAKKASTAQLDSKADAGVVAQLQTTVNTKADTSTVSALSGRVSNVETEQTALSARMDTFTNLPEGSTTGDAELIDIRIAANGKTYESAGASVRGQVSELKSDVDNIQKSLSHTISKNLIGPQNGVLYPCFIKGGTDITMSTSTGQAMGSELRFDLYDAGKNKIDYCRILQGQTSKTYSTYADKGDIYYISQASSYGVPMQVEIGSVATDYTPYIASPEFLSEEIKQTSVIVTTQGDRPILISEKKSNGSIDITVPIKVLVYGNGMYEDLVTLSQNPTVYNLPHANFLMYSLKNKTFSVVAATNFKAQRDCVICAYNNDGRIRGQWEQYQRSRIEEFLSRNAVKIFTNDTYEQTINITDGDNTYLYRFVVTVPKRIFIMGYTDKMITKDFTATTNYTLKHNDVLYYDLSDETIKIINVDSLNTIYNKTIVVLVYNNGGVARGQWANYQRRRRGHFYNVENFKTIEFSCRQGEVGGCPENSLVGCALAKQWGYNKVRVSVQFTSDGIPVCFHDEKLNTNGIVYKDGEVTTDDYAINDLTYTQLLAYDFGAYKGEEFEGTTIAKVEDFIKQSKRLGQKIVLEIKDGHTPTTDEVAALYNMVVLNGMLPHTVFSGYASTGLGRFTAIDPKCNIGYIAYVTSAEIDNAIGYLTGKNEVYYDMYSFDNNWTDALRIKAIKGGLKLKYGSVHQASLIQNAVNCDVIECANMANPAYVLMHSYN